MPEKNNHNYDILVAGAGFAGSLMALILHNIGFRICLVEKGQHPRFAIGESSTPIADMLLRRLSKQYDMPWLAHFSRYGSWQQAHPEVVCGIKRGFSYFKHHPGKEFTTDANHINELLVAASTDDMQSDTNWLRADFDAFLVTKVKEANIDYFDLTEIVQAERIDKWKFYVKGDKSAEIIANFFIDATGSGGLLEKMLGIKSSSDGFLTNSFAVFSHFNNVPRWMDTLQKTGIPTGDFPYDPDHSALHQILDEGWLWMLRFNNERTSLGFALNGKKNDFDNMPAEQIWNEMLNKYPSLYKLLKDVPLSAQPGRIIKSGRLQRKAERCFGDGWLALPHTVGFVDPLFSSGIAHSLSGIVTTAHLLQQYWGNNNELYHNLALYEDSVFEELKFIDQLVAGCYQTMDNFGLFNAWTMLYFAAIIQYEQLLLQNKPPSYFLGADNPEMRNMVNLCYRELMQIINKQSVTTEDVNWFTASVRQRIAPVNIAGLLDPVLKNMYQHTAVNI